MGANAPLAPFQPTSLYSGLMYCQYTCNTSSDFNISLQLPLTSCLVYWFLNFPATFAKMSTFEFCKQTRFVIDFYFIYLFRYEANRSELHNGDCGPTFVKKFDQYLPKSNFYHLKNSVIVYFYQKMEYQEPKSKQFSSKGNNFMHPKIYGQTLSFLVKYVSKSHFHERWQLFMSKTIFLHDKNIKTRRFYPWQF